MWCGVCLFYMVWGVGSGELRLVSMGMIVLGVGLVLGVLIIGVIGVVVVVVDVGDLVGEVEFLGIDDVVVGMVFFGG